MNKPKVYVMKWSELRTYNVSRLLELMKKCKKIVCIDSKLLGYRVKIELEEFKSQ